MVQSVPQIATDKISWLVNLVIIKRVPITSKDSMTMEHALVDTSCNTLMMEIADAVMKDTLLIPADQSTSSNLVWVLKPSKMEPIALTIPTDKTS